MPAYSDQSQARTGHLSGSERMLTGAQADGPQMLRRSQVRKRLGIGKDKFLELVNTGQLAAIRAGDAPNSPFLVSEEALADFIERNRVKPADMAS
jgi:hypothetical protein